MEHEYKVGDKVRIVGTGGYDESVVPGTVGQVLRIYASYDLITVGGPWGGLTFWRNEIEPVDPEPLDKTAIELQLLKATMRQHGGGDLVKLVETTVALLP